MSKKAMLVMLVLAAAGLGLGGCIIAPCDYDCGVHGQCISVNNIETCDCDVGYSFYNGSCVADDPCYSVDCGANGHCEDVYGEAVCYCNVGYHVEGNSCVSNGGSVADIKFTWLFDVNGVPTSSCNTAGVDYVRVKIKKNSITQFDQVFPCSDAGEIITNWALGMYDLLVQGYCSSDSAVGYELDVYMEITQTGMNDYGPQTLAEVGGGC
jgi:hypothetical protein